MSRIELGRVGAALAPADNREFLAGVRQLEEIGVSTIWLTGGQIQRLSQITAVLLATDHVRVASGIISVDRFSVDEVAVLYDELEAEYPGRFVVGLGGAHGPKPIETLSAYLDALAHVPRDRIVLAALGPRMLAFARERASGAFPVLVTPEYTASAREQLGDDITLAIDQLVVVEADPDTARARSLGSRSGSWERCRSTRPTSGAWGSPTTRSRRAPTASSTRSCRGATPTPSPRRSPRTTRRVPITSRSAWSAGPDAVPVEQMAALVPGGRARRSAPDPVEEARPARRSWVGGNPSSRRAGACRVTDRPVTDGPAPPARRCPPKPMCNIGIHGASTPVQPALAVAAGRRRLLREPGSSRARHSASCSTSRRSLLASGPPAWHAMTRSESGSIQSS